MSLFRLQKFINFSFLNSLIISFFFLYSIFIIRYHYDGHHIGLVFSNALDLVSGKLPYKDIFVQYGFLTTLIHAILLIIFENKVIFLSIFTAVFYSLSVFVFSLILKNLINSYYGFIATLLILFNHPIPWLPWSNYIAFFFLSLGIFFLTNNSKNYYLVGLFFGLAVLSRQDFFIPLVLSALIFLIFYSIKFKKILIDKSLNLFAGFITPLIIFFIYLLYNNIFFHWQNFLIIPYFYLEIYQFSLSDLIINFIIFFLSDSFFNFIVKPQYFIISIILISNTILIFFKILNKINIPYNVFYICILSSLLCSLSLKIEIFRLYTSVIIGLIPLLYFFSRIKNINLQSNLIKLLLLPSIFSIFFYPLGNNSVFKKINLNEQNMKITNERFKFHKWPVNKIKSINYITELTKKCNVDYLDNLTFDTLYSTIGNYDRVKMMPFEKKSNKDSNFHLYVESLKNSEINYFDKINFEIQKENIILLINENNNSYQNKKLIFTNAYDVIKLNESDIVGRPNILYIYLPKRCLN